MGEQITAEHSSAADRELFRSRLDDSLSALSCLLRRPGFGEPADTLGAELEVFLVAPDGTPVPRNDDVLAAARDDRLTYELCRFAVEVNLTPRRTGERPFSGLRAEVEEVRDLLARACAPLGARPLLVGLLPTTGPADVTARAITGTTRFRVLDRELSHRNGTPFRVGIDGDDHCTARVDSVALPGACCSWQVHLATSPARLAVTYDAVQAATAPVLAVAVNSPLLFGRRLWQETRIPLYEQGMGDHRTARAGGHVPRVSFGTAWTREPMEVFENLVREHDVLVAELSEEDPMTALRQGRAPSLAELRLHQSTVWRWNRPVYDPAGNVRVEARALPSGPTGADMAANAAFLVGLAAHLAADGGFTAALPFGQARDNFYRAARLGPRAELRWPLPGGVREVPATDLVGLLLPAAADGLTASGVHRDEVDAHLGVVERRAATGRTGARWQRAAFEALRSRSSPDQALRELVRRYGELSATDQPVHTWPAPLRGVPW